MRMEHTGTGGIIGAPLPAMSCIHIADIEAAINHWRARAPSSDGVGLAPEIEALAVAITTTCGRAADKLVMPRNETEPAPTAAALDKLKDRLAELRHAGASRKLPLEDVARFYMFVEALKALARDVDALMGQLDLVRA